MLHIENIVRSYGGKTVLRGVDLEVVRGEIVCLLGPSGCGKTTLLRIVAGLEQADAGEVRLEGRPLGGVAVHERDFGLMFQDFALFPHMNVAENVIFGLRMRGISREVQRERLADVLALVGLSGFERRDVNSLSGGERQRVALARSLAPQPRLLMLDEPMGALDATLRDRLVVELREIIKRVGLTALYVTHDRAEAFAIADRVAVMNLGLIEQVAAPETLYCRPETAFVAGFLGLHNIVPVLRQDGENARTPVGVFTVSGHPRELLLHPDGLTLTHADGVNAISGTILERTFAGDVYRLRLGHESGIVLQFEHPTRAGRVPLPGEAAAVLAAPDLVLPLV